MSKRYPIAIEPGNDRSAFGVAVPDLPGCFSAGDTAAEAIANSKVAIGLWLEEALDRGREVPDPRSLEAHQANPDFDGFQWVVVSVEAPDKPTR